MTFDEWLQTGIDRGWCTDIHCSMHDGITMSEDEQDEVEDGGDPCIPVIRLWAQ